ncbi:hypothetical protein A3Q56_08323 [Intoshia linei]|uniref:PiggyBac transposable element-derived protein domain-containing protein n=1 Tax=Intoshia linei TaxID=1819745 RepID=A0A177ARF5_9BILA|nr:hypothetical protein A3Q56_08323 [Intoshia linei]
MKYYDKREVLMISTFHGMNYDLIKRKWRNGKEISKPHVILDYNRVKGGINLSDQLIEYYNFARKSIKWYRKIVFQLISISVLNSSIIYNNYYNLSLKMTLAEFSESIIKELIKPKTACTNSKPKSHPLTIIGSRNGKFIRRRCKSCYQVLSNNNNRENA